MPNSERPTLPPTAADQEAQEFESQMQEHGESGALLNRLTPLLASMFGAKAEAA